MADLHWSDNRCLLSMDQVFFLLPLLLLLLADLHLGCLHVALINTWQGDSDAKIAVGASQEDTNLTTVRTMHY